MTKPERLITNLGSCRTFCSEVYCGIWRLNWQCWSVLRGSHCPLIKSPESVLVLIAQNYAIAKITTLTVLASKIAQPSPHPI